MGVPPADLASALALADVADAVSRAHFRSEAIRTTTKGDGTPVSQVDLAVEEAMLALVRAERSRRRGARRGGRGASLGRRGSRWILDGIDGTHNYAAGRPGWGTIVALEIDGEIAVGLVSCAADRPALVGDRGGGAWSAPYRADGTFDATSAAPMRCTTTDSLGDASVIVMPFEGFLLGWRNERAEAVHASPSAAQPVLRARRGDGGRRRARRRDPDARRACGTSPPRA